MKNRISPIEKKAEVIMYTNMGIPHLETKTLSAQEEVRRMVALSLSEFEGYMDVKPEERVQFLRNNGLI